MIKLWRPLVNFINILHENFMYESLFSSFFYLHVTSKKLPKRCLYKKFEHKMLMKLTPSHSTDSTPEHLALQALGKIRFWKRVKLLLFQEWNEVHYIFVVVFGCLRLSPSKLWCGLRGASLISAYYFYMQVSLALWFSTSVQYVFSTCDFLLLLLSRLVQA